MGIFRYINRLIKNENMKNIKAVKDFFNIRLRGYIDLEDLYMKYKMMLLVLSINKIDSKEEKIKELKENFLFALDTPERFLIWGFDEERLKEINSEINGLCKHCHGSCKRKLEIPPNSIKYVYCKSCDSSGFKQRTENSRFAMSCSYCWNKKTVLTVHWAEKLNEIICPYCKGTGKNNAKEH